MVFLSWANGREFSAEFSLQGMMGQNVKTNRCGCQPGISNSMVCFQKWQRALKPLETSAVEPTYISLHLAASKKTETN